MIMGAKQLFLFFYVCFFTSTPAPDTFSFPVVCCMVVVRLAGRLCLNNRKSCFLHIFFLIFLCFHLTNYYQKGNCKLWNLFLYLLLCCRYSLAWDFLSFLHFSYHTHTHTGTQNSCGKMEKQGREREKKKISIISTGKAKTTNSLNS